MLRAEETETESKQYSCLPEQPDPHHLSGFSKTIAGPGARAPRRAARRRARASSAQLDHLRRPGRRTSHSSEAATLPYITRKCCFSLLITVPIFGPAGSAAAAAGSPAASRASASPRRGRPPPPGAARPRVSRCWTPGGGGPARRRRAGLPAQGRLRSSRRGQSPPCAAPGNRRGQAVHGCPKEPPPPPPPDGATLARWLVDERACTPARRDCHVPNRPAMASGATMASSSLTAMRVGRRAEQSSRKKDACAGEARAWPVSAGLGGWADLGGLLASDASPRGRQCCERRRGSSTAPS